jgi:hypothetical protein
LKDCKEDQRFEKRKTKELPVEREKIAGGLYCVFLNSKGIKVYLGIYIYSRSTSHPNILLSTSTKGVWMCVWGAL